MVGTPPDAFAPGRFAHPTRSLEWNGGHVIARALRDR